MKKEIKRANYRKQDSQTKNIIAGIICLICLVAVILWQPSPKFGKPADVVVKEDAHAFIYAFSGAQNKWRLDETDRIIPAGTQLKAVAECSTYKWAVDDNEGNRFAIDKSKVEGDVSELKTITPGYCHAYRGMSLDGRRLDDIMKEAGDYIYADATAGKYYFEQIVLTNGSERHKGALLTVNSDGVVTNTEPTSQPQHNLYTSLPFFDRIISLNLYTKFLPFTQDAETEPYEGFSLKKIGSSLWGIITSIITFILLIIAITIAFGLSVVITYGAGNLLFNAIGRFTKLKNSVITTVEYIYMVPCIYIILLSMFFACNDIWLLILPIAIGVTVFMVQFVESHSIRDARCSECRSLNTIDVEEITYSTGYDVEGKEGKSMDLGKEEDIDTVRVIEHRLVETHTCCCNCNHTEDSSRTYDDKGEWVKIETVACPKCGKHTLDAFSTVTESTAQYVTETYTSKGKMKDKGINLKTLDHEYERVDRESTYGHWTGYVVYEKHVWCTECDYCNTVEFRYTPDTSSHKISEAQIKNRFKPKEDIINDLFN